MTQTIYRVEVYHPTETTVLEMFEYTNLSAARSFARRRANRDGRAVIIEQTDPIVPLPDGFGYRGGIIAVWRIEPATSLQGGE